MRVLIWTSPSSSLSFPFLNKFEKIDQQTSVLVHRTFRIYTFMFLKKEYFVEDNKETEENFIWSEIFIRVRRFYYNLCSKLQDYLPVADKRLS